MEAYRIFIKVQGIVLLRGTLMSSVYRSRLTGKFDEKTARFISSLEDDKRIFIEDIDGTEAHNIMLYEQGIITEDELAKILYALEKLRSEMGEKEIEYNLEVEDIHEYIETYVIREIGIEIGGKLHSGRSRNDQVTVDMRMYLRTQMIKVSELILNLLDTLLTIAEDHTESLMLLYTHTQQAQIGVFSHYLLAYTDSIFRDLQRVQDCYDRINLNPLGAGPIGGSSLNLNRMRTTSLLGFNGVIENSIDAISAKDFELETACILAIHMSTLSRIAEDFIIWSSTEYGFLEIADEYSSVSSVMPQKKNPCTLELIRGKTGKVYGALVSLLTIIKGLPTGYNRDLQEMKTSLWDSLDAVTTSLPILTSVISTVIVKKDRMRKVASESYAFAMDLAEHLIESTSLPFREAHKLVGHLIKEMIRNDIKPKEITAKSLNELSLKVLGKNISVTDMMIQRSIDVESCLSQRKTLGSPAPKEVKRMIKNRKKLLDVNKNNIASRVRKLEAANQDLRITVNKYLSQ
jgi:argininosuccinate lyase